MVTGGGLAIGWDSIGKEFNWARVGVLLIICGALIAIYAKLKVRTEENAAAFRTGYDLGLEDGDRLARKELARSRPVVVDMSAHRCHHDQALSH